MIHIYPEITLQFNEQCPCLVPVKGKLKLVCIWQGQKESRDSFQEMFLKDILREIWTIFSLQTALLSTFILIPALVLSIFPRQFPLRLDVSFPTKIILLSFISPQVQSHNWLLCNVRIHKSAMSLMFWRISNVLNTLLILNHIKKRQEVKPKLQVLSHLKWPVCDWYDWGAIRKQLM